MKKTASVALLVSLPLAALAADVRAAPPKVTPPKGAIVQKPITRLVLPAKLTAADAKARIDGPLPVTATLVDANDAPLAGKSIQFVLLNESNAPISNVTAKTDAAGTVTAKLDGTKVPFPRTLTFKASFAGDDSASAASAEGKVEVQPFPTVCRFMNVDSSMEAIAAVIGYHPDNAESPDYIRYIAVGNIAATVNGQKATVKYVDTSYHSYTISLQPRDVTEWKVRMTYAPSGKFAGCTVERTIKNPNPPPPPPR